LYVKGTENPEQEYSPSEIGRPDNQCRTSSARLRCRPCPAGNLKTRSPSLKKRTKNRKSLDRKAEKRTKDVNHGEKDRVFLRGRPGRKKGQREVSVKKNTEGKTGAKEHTISWDSTGDLSGFGLRTRRIGRQEGLAIAAIRGGFLKRQTAIKNRAKLSGQKGSTWPKNY